MRPSTVFVSSALAVALALPVIAAPAQTPDALETSAASVVAKAGQYLSEYRQKLSYVMATEKYVQKLKGGISLYDVDETLESDVFFVFLPVEKVWMAIRDVAKVDGEKVPRANVRALLNSTAAAGVARELKDRNARYNLGTIVRNFNEPTLSLLALDEDHRIRYQYKREGVTRRGGSTLVTISYVERGIPTLISMLDNKPAFSEGEIVVDAATGRIEKAELRVELGKAKAKLTTTYALDSKLGMWLPKEFAEEYSEKGQSVKGLARYSDYQRFDVEVRIK
jgi:hypothetical protein